MNEIVIQNIGGQLTTSSFGVAEKFEKQHKHVLKTIESTYINERGRAYKCYEMTKYSFSLLVSNGKAFLFTKSNLFRFF